MSGRSDISRSPKWLGFYTWGVVILVLLPIAVIVAVSINNTAALELPTHGISFQWYRAALNDSKLLDSFSLSIGIAAGATAISLTIGAPAAYVIARFDLRLLDALFLAPIAFPAIIFGAALLMFFAPLGLVRTVPGLLIGHSVVVLPYIVRTMATTIRGIDVRLEEAALMLGASGFKVMSHIIVPLAMPGLISAACFAFIISFDEFSVSLFLVGTGVMTLPIEMYQRIQFIIDPTIAAASTLLLLGSIVFVVIVERFVGLQRLLVGE
jgi:putative spermidine/putrescine transport system permease protein